MSIFESLLRKIIFYQIIFEIQMLVGDILASGVVMQVDFSQNFLHFDISQGLSEKQRPDSMSIFAKSIPIFKFDLHSTDVKSCRLSPGVTWGKVIIVSMGNDILNHQKVTNDRWVYFFLKILMKIYPTTILDF